jgi:enediyne biosynthesis protein E4
LRHPKCFVNSRCLLVWVGLQVLLLCSAATWEPREPRVSPGARITGFELVNLAQCGVLFTNTVPQDRHLTNNILLDGSGVACGDVDGDGLVDLYFCRLEGGNALYQNLGAWKFRDITEQSGTRLRNLAATGVALADIDGDSDLDLIVNSLGEGTRVLLNDGKGHFTASAQAPLNMGFAGHSMALADVNGDGALDLYVANYRMKTIRDEPDTKFRLRVTDGQPQLISVNGRPLTDPEFTNRFTLKADPRRGTAESEEHGEPDALFLNDGKGRFSLVPFIGGAFLDEAGRALTRPLFDWGLSVMMRDLNGDGAPDIYVCNDFTSPDRVWINNGRGQFRAIASHAIRQTSLFSMGVDVADVNRDGVWDIFVSDMLSREHQRRLTQKAEMAADPIPAGDLAARAQTGRNTLLLGRGDGTFAEIAQFAGVQASEWSWTPMFLDVDLDGYEDLLVANGFERDGMNMDVAKLLKVEKVARKLPPGEQLRLRARYPRLDTPNVAFRNLGNCRFNDASREWNFDQRAVSQGMACADLDNDGDLDVVINNFNGSAFLLRNECAAPRLAVRLKGLAPNTSGIGAKITVTGGPVIQSQEMMSGGRYLSSDDAMRVFAAGSSTNMLRVEVGWRSGRQTVVENVPANSLCVVDETGAVSLPQRSRLSSQPYFEDVSARLNHRHVEEPFDDFERQPLLPLALSQLGPGLSWGDIDGDGFEDLIIGSGKGGRSGIFRNTGRGAFEPLTNSLNAAAPRDQTTVLILPRQTNTSVLISGLANYEENTAEGAAVQQINRGENANILSGVNMSVGPLACADVNGDGMLDLFVGGRVAAARYPEAAGSFLLRQSDHNFSIDPQDALIKAGLVSGAVFTDFNGDGAPDLVLACDWGPIRAFENRRGTFVDVTTALGLAQFQGRWTGVTSGDFDGDGRMDLVAANFGENTKYEFARSKPLRLYFGDFDGNGVTEILESYFDETSKHYVPARRLDVFERGMPWIQQHIPTWVALSLTSADDVLGEYSRAAQVREVNRVSTTVFLNQGSRFEPARLPDEAQFAPAFGVCVADFDGDGSEDIFLAQNFFGVTADTSRSDAGRGLWLRGDGRGGFKAMAAQESGIAIYGEQRGAAVCDFDGDGRVDLAVAQNAAETKLFHNTRARPGLRIRLAGSADNPTGIGAVLRVSDGQRWGPAREIHAGSGYWSQDSAVQVMARIGDRVQVRWPEGKTTTSIVPRDAAEIRIAADGMVTSIR